MDEMRSIGVLRLGHAPSLRMTGLKFGHCVIGPLGDWKGKTPGLKFGHCVIGPSGDWKATARSFDSRASCCAALSLR